MTSQLNLISWNVRGINSPIKRRKILTYLKRQSTDVIFIQETHLSDAEHVKLRRDWVGHVYHSSFNSKARGVAILINKKLNFKLISIEKDGNGRFILVKGELNSNRVTLVSIYGPNHDDATFFNDLVLKFAIAEGPGLVGGDFNLVLDPNLDRSTPRSLNRSKAASFLLRGMKDLGLCDIWRQLNPKAKDFSFFSNVHKSYSRIDMFLIPHNMTARITDCAYLPATLSDHNPMKMTWEIDAAQSKPLTWRFKSYMLKDPEFIRFMRGHIDVFMATNTNSSSHAFIWEALKAYMRGQILSYSSYKIREKRKTLANLENEIRDLEHEHTQTKSEMVLNTLSLKRIQYDNLCTNKAEADLARTNYHYYEFGDKTSKLLAWQIKREETEKTIHSIITDDRRSLFTPQSRI